MNYIINSLTEGLRFHGRRLNAGLLGREEPNVSDAVFSVKEYQQTQCSPQTPLVCLYTDEFTANICFKYSWLTIFLVVVLLYFHKGKNF